MTGRARAALFAASAFLGWILPAQTLHAAPPQTPPASTAAAREARLTLSVPALL